MKLETGGFLESMRPPNLSHKLYPIILHKIRLEYKGLTARKAGVRRSHPATGKPAFLYA
jgi:hypothetical protein